MLYNFFLWYLLLFGFAHDRAYQYYLAYCSNIVCSFVKCSLSQPASRPYMGYLKLSEGFSQHFGIVMNSN